MSCRAPPLWACRSGCHDDHHVIVPRIAPEVIYQHRGFQNTKTFNGTFFPEMSFLDKAQWQWVTQAKLRPSVPELQPPAYRFLLSHSNLQLVHGTLGLRSPRLGKIIPFYIRFICVNIFLNHRLLLWLCLPVVEAAALKQDDVSTWHTNSRQEIGCYLWDKLNQNGRETQWVFVVFISWQPMENRASIYMTYLGINLCCHVLRFHSPSSRWRCMDSGSENLGLLMFALIKSWLKKITQSYRWQTENFVKWET